MTRVLSVVGRSIMVSIYDVRPNDIVYVSGDERDLIVDWVERDGDRVRFHYKESNNVRSYLVRHTVWMCGDVGGRVFIHDLMNERAEFNGEAHPLHQLTYDMTKEIFNDATRS